MPEALIADAGRGQLLYLDNLDAPNPVWLGGPGTGAGQWNRPRGVAAGNGGFLVADSGNHRIVSIVDAGGGGWQHLGALGSGAAQFNTPTGVAVDSDGRIYIADTGNSRIVRIDGIDGSGWTTYGVRGAPTPVDPAAVGKFRGPAAVAVDADGGICIADSESNRVVRISSMLGDGWVATRLMTPVAVVDDGQADHFLVCALGARTISRVDVATGTVVASAPTGTLAGPGAVSRLASTLIALDSAARRVVEFDLALGGGEVKTHLADIGVSRPVGMVAW